MSVADERTPRRRMVLMIVATVLVVVGAAVAVVLVMSSDGDTATVPPLTTAERQAGAVRVIYPDRSLPDVPELVMVGGKRVSLYFVRADGSGDDVTAVLRVGTEATVGDLPVEVTLHKGESKTVKGYVITLLDAFDTGDLSRDAADVTVTAP